MAVAACDETFARCACPCCVSQPLPSPPTPLSAAAQIVGRRLAFTVRNQLLRASLIQDIAFFDRRVRFFSEMHASTRSNTGEIRNSGDEKRLCCTSFVVQRTHFHRASRTVVLAAPPRATSRAASATTWRTCFRRDRSSAGGARALGIRLDMIIATTAETSLPAGFPRAWYPLSKQPVQSLLSSTVESMALLVGAIAMCFWQSWQLSLLAATTLLPATCAHPGSTHPHPKRCPVPFYSSPSRRYTLPFFVT